MIRIANREVGDGFPALIVAELSANHQQNFLLAVRSIRAMKAAGADAVKLQTFTPDTITIASNHPRFRLRQGARWDGQLLYRLYQKAYMPWAWQPKLKKIAEEEGLIFFSSPFDRTAVDLLAGMRVPAYKVASSEITDIPLIEYVAARKKPVIISTGVAMLADIEEAVSACRRMGNNQIALLKCTTAYPAPPEEMNLRTIPHLAETFRVVAGLSDHSLGVAIPVAAVALGARIIEKHFVLDRKRKALDAAFSLEPEEFRAMVQGVREAEKALGKVSYELTPRAKRSRAYARSLFAVQEVQKGETFTAANVRSIRPGCGLHPRHLSEILGKKAVQDISRGTPLSWDLVDWGAAR